VGGDVPAELPFARMEFKLDLSSLTFFQVYKPSTSVHSEGWFCDDVSNDRTMSADERREFHPTLDPKLNLRV